MVITFEFGSLVLLGVFLLFVCSLYWRVGHPGPSTGKLLLELMNEVLEASLTVAPGSVQKALALFPEGALQPVPDSLVCHKAQCKEEGLGLVYLAYDVLVPLESTDEDAPAITEKRHIEEIRIYREHRTAALTFETPVLVRVAYNDEIVDRETVLGVKGAQLAGEIIRKTRLQQQSL